MSTKSAFLTASLTVLAFAVPAQAQDGRYDSPPEAVRYESREVVQDGGDQSTYDDVSEEAYDKAYDYVTYANSAPDSAARPIPAPPPPSYPSYPTIAPRTVVTSGTYHDRPRGYTAEQRANWLAGCRTIYLGDYTERYDNDHDRDAHRRAIAETDRYCEDYLARYERGGMGGYPAGGYPAGGYPTGSYPVGSYPMGSYPVIMVPMQTTRRVIAREIVREEWIDADDPRYEPPPADRRRPNRR